MKKVLVGYDFSEPANRALKMAVELARASGASVTLMHVIPVFTAADLYGARTAALWQQMKASAESDLLKTAATITHVPVDTHAVIGSAGDEITRAADELNADLVVVGSTGVGAVKRLFLGSVADRVAHLSAKPVLIVK